MSDDVRQLVERCLAGQRDAIVELIERYRGQVFGLCYRMLGQRQDAEDATQETFIRVIKSLRRWDPNRPLEPWLLAIAGNRCRTALAARRRRPAMQPLVQPVVDRRGDPHGACHLAEEVQLALMRLRHELREAFVLFHQQQLSYAEIAEAMHCPIGTVKTWVHRARRQLLAQLQRRGVIEGVEHAVPRV